MRLFEGDAMVEPARHRDAGSDRGPAGLCLVTEELEVLDARADENDAGLRAAPREVTSLGEKPVAGVDRLAAALLSGRDHGIHVQVRPRPTSRERVGIVSDAAVKALHVVLGVDGDRAQPQVCGCPGDPDGDLAAVGDEQAAEAHGLAARSVASRLPSGRPVESKSIKVKRLSPLRWKKISFDAPP